VRFDKEGVFACELAGDEWNTAAWLLAYTREVVLTLPMLLNMADPSLKISSQAYGGKLAVAVGGGSKYPMHVDNGGGGFGGDLRKVTLVYYLNPGWDSAKDGGAFRIYHGEGLEEDLSPEGDRLVIFWADGCSHEVLPNWGNDVAKHRYAQTIWLTTEDPTQIKTSI
jgi:Rps23 Pro-64 3,4-dihydroxylase Tpa1-like proline 4-hydroxylase